MKSVPFNLSYPSGVYLLWYLFSIDTEISESELYGSLFLQQNKEKKKII